MPNRYEKKLKNEVAHLICVERKSTMKTAEEHNVPLKTVEKWVTAFNKNNKVFEEEVVSEVPAEEKVEEDKVAEEKDAK